MNVKPSIRWAIFSALIAILLTSSVVFAQTFPKSLTGWLIAQRLTVNTISTLTGDVTMGDDLIVTDNVNVDGLMLTPATLISLTNGATLTPASSFQPIGAPGTVYITLGVCPSGLVTTLENAIAQTINFTDTGTSKLTANFAMGQYDTLTLIGDGTNCFEIARANN